MESVVYSTEKCRVKNGSMFSGDCDIWDSI